MRLNPYFVITSTMALDLEASKVAALGGISLLAGVARSRLAYRDFGDNTLASRAVEGVYPFDPVFSVLLGSFYMGQVSDRLVDETVDLLAPPTRKFVYPVVRPIASRTKEVAKRLRDRFTSV